MNLNHVVGAGLMFVFLVNPAAAQSCAAGSERVTGGNTLRTLLTGKTVCAARASERWQEFHNSTGALVDYKRGPSDVVDPSKTVGSWSATNGSSATVSYNYGTGGSFAYIVCAVPTVAAPTSYTFVGASTIPGATLKVGPVACN
jgi:hypothetical protein